MPLTDDPNDPGLKNIQADGQQEKYLVLSEEERAKGFVRPVRRGYIHRGRKPTHELVDLTPEQRERYGDYGYVKYEPYEEGEHGSAAGRYWTQAQLNSGCGAYTTMALPLAETYARDPKFYGGTFCSNCGGHFDVEEFVWADDGTVVGS